MEFGIQFFPDVRPSEKSAAQYFDEAGSRNAFAGYAYDAAAVIAAAAPVALKSAKPGTPEFRQAMRDAIEGVKEVHGTHAVYTMSPTNHYGVDKRARVLVRVENGEWRLLR